MEYKTKYEVRTHWGAFRLDEGAYRDYLAGKLWLTWSPRASAQAEEAPAQLQEQRAAGEEAVRLRDSVPPEEVYAALRRRKPGARVAVPYRGWMRDLPIDELNLSVRASNCLMRAGAVTFGKLHALMCREGGLRGIRNLGTKSEKEIGAAFLTACYRQLVPAERAGFWQQVLEREQEDAHGVV